MRRWNQLRGTDMSKTHQADRRRLPPKELRLYRAATGNAARLVQHSPSVQRPWVCFPTLHKQGIKVHKQGIKVPEVRRGKEVQEFILDYNALSQSGFYETLSQKTKSLQCNVTRSSGPGRGC